MTNRTIRMQITADTLLQCLRRIIGINQMRTLARRYSGRWLRLKYSQLFESLQLIEPVGAIVVVAIQLSCIETLREVGFPTMTRQAVGPARYLPRYSRRLFAIRRRVIAVEFTFGPLGRHEHRVVLRFVPQIGIPCPNADLFRKYASLKPPNWSPLPWWKRECLHKHRTFRELPLVR